MKSLAFGAVSRALGLCVSCLVLVAGCGKNSDTPAQAPAPAAPQAASAVPAAPAAPAGEMKSSVAVKGDEPLPPSHPPVGGAAPHPSGTAPIDSKELAAQHPQSSEKKQLSVNVPDSVKGKWAAVNLAVTGPDGKERTARVAIGDKLSLDKDTQLRVVHYLPSYTSDFSTVTSASNEEKNPAIQVETVVGGKAVEQGWVFKALPEFNSYRSERIKVKLISAEASGK